MLVRAGGAWTVAAKLTASDAAAADQFGFSVALDAGTAMVSAPLDDHAGGANAGSVYVFSQTGALWNQTQRLTSLDAAAGDGLGQAVSLDAGRALIGAHSAEVDVSGTLVTDAGAAYVFVSAGGTWASGQKLTAPNPGLTDKFGQAVAIRGGLLCVGARLEDLDAVPSDIPDAGAVYVFTFNAGTWTHVGGMAPIAPQADGYFGASVGLHDETLIVGSYGAGAAPLDNASAAYVFDVSSCAGR